MNMSKEKLEQIFYHNDLNFTEDELFLNRNWYSNINIPGYKLIKNTEPTIHPIEFQKRIFNIEDCGQSIYIKQK